VPDNPEADQMAEELCDQAIDAYADANYAQAIDLYKQALEINPKYGDAYTGLAMCHQQLDDLDAAIAVTRRYVEVAPDDILAFTNLSMFYQKKGMISEAEAAGAEARRLDWKRQLKEAKDKKPDE
jgi:tetratricopeptide (TPR) repeat protein